MLKLVGLPSAATGDMTKAVYDPDIDGVIGVAQGGTGATTEGGARTSLGLTYNVDVQAYDVELAAIAGLTSAADQLPYFTGLGTAALATFTAAGRSMAAGVSATAQTALLNAMVGDSGAGGTKGMVPAPASGDAAAGKFLKADGTYAVPAGAGGVSDGDKGDITVTATGATWTIDPATVTLAKQANIATATVIGRNTAGAGVPEALTTIPTGTVPAFTGDVTSAGGALALTIANLAVTDAKVAAANKDGAAATASMRTLGTGAAQAAAGDDARLTDARTPTAHVHSGADITSGTLPLARLSGITNAEIAAAAAIALSKLATQADLTILGNNTGGAGVPLALTAAQTRTVLGLATVATSASAADLSAGTLLAARMPALTGNVTTTAGAVATTIAAGAVTLAMQANLAANRIMGNNTGSAATPIALTGAQTTAMLSAFVASGGSHAAGIVPTPGAASGTTRFLREDATWAVPAGASGLIDADTVRGRAIQSEVFRFDPAPAFRKRHAGDTVASYTFGI